MKYIKSLIFIAAAEILSLFLGLTLAGSSSVFMRSVSAVCTAGILICLTVNYAMSVAKEDLRLERVNGTKTPAAAAFALGGIMSAPSIISWIILKISHISGSFDFYRWHKLLNAYFLQLYNFINSDAETAALTPGQVNIMLLPAFIPFAAFIAAYFLVYKGVISESEK